MKQWVANEEPPSLRTRVEKFAKIDENTTSYSMKGIKTNARIRVEQDVDLVLKNMKLKILGQPHDEVLMVTESQYKNHKANENRIILKDGLLFTRQSRKPQKLKQASEDHCGTNTSVLRSLIKLLLITQVLAVSLAEFFTAVFPVISWIKI